MSALAAGLAGKSIAHWAKIPDQAAKSWLAGAVHAFEKLAQRVAMSWAERMQWPTLGDVFAWYEHQPDFGWGFDAQSRFIAVRLALIDAAFDICLIGRGIDSAYRIDVNALEKARISTFWLDDLWLDKLATHRVALHNSASAEAFISTCITNLANRVSEFNERAATFGKLALAAYDHDQLVLATDALKKSVDCLLGYGWRKDVFASEVLDALKMLIEVGDEDAKGTLLELAGAFHQITEYTDGDETNHIRSEYYATVAKYYPDRIAPILEALITSSDWRYAEDLYEELPMLPWVQDARGAALLSTYIMPSEKSAVEKAASEGSVLSLLRKKVGPNIENKRKEDRYSSSGQTDSSKDAPEPPRLEHYPPGKLSALLAERNRLRIFDSSESSIKDWLNYWDAKGQTAAALADLEARLSETRLHLDIQTGLDTAAELALKIHGRSESFKWLVRAHVVRYGWQRYFTSREEAEARLDLVARDYKARWKEFIRDTSKPALDLRESRNGLVIGLTRLVYFLVRLDELGLARAHTAAMVEAFKAELAEQPLETPSWA